MAPLEQRLTTQQTADLLGISHPTLIRLLEENEIPYEKPGRHRRVRLSDVLATGTGAGKSGAAAGRPAK